MGQNVDQEERSGLGLLTGLAVFTGAAAALSLVGFLYNHFLVNAVGGTLQERAQLGDSFGAAAALLSAAAVGGLVWSLILQRSELKEQRAIAVEQRARLAETAKLNERSAQISRFNSVVDIYTTVIAPHHSAENTKRRQAVREHLDRWKGARHKRTGGLTRGSQNRKSARSVTTTTHSVC